MTAADMLEDSFPHGTMNGYRQGCKTGHCPAPITCSVVRSRYVSDWAFRKRVDAGWTVEQIAEADAEVVRAEALARMAERASARAKMRPKPRPVRAGEADERGRVRKTNITRVRFTTEDLEFIRRMHAEEKNDTEIGLMFDPPRRANSIRDRRIKMGLRTIGTSGGRKLAS